MKFLALVLLLPSLLSATDPTPATRRWWSHLQAMANDSLAGRDTGSEGYRKAAGYVVRQFAAAGLRPAGENGSWYQSVPMHKVRLRADRSDAALISRDGSVRRLEWLHQISIAARAGLPEAIDAPLVFAGQSAPPEASGKILVRLNTGMRRAAAPASSTALGTLAIDSTTGPEPARWPVQYAVAVTLAGDTPAPSPRAAGLALRFNPAAAEDLFAGSGHTYRELAALAEAGKPLPTFDLAVRLRAHLNMESSDLRADNILGVLPGSDPALAGEYVVVSAHLDGYGIGEPWKDGDNIYNGAFDDAAYVATLIDFAERLKDSGTRLKRPLLFAVWTGEEKGLLGSRWYVAHPTLPRTAFVANVNLDQLRPIFPLKILTTLALDDSTLGDTVRRVATAMDIRVQPDPEPERNLLRRSDHWSFMGIGVPSVGFIFGYEKGSPEEAVYRRWYAERYHSPKDDLAQPWDPAAAAKFNDFFGRVVREIAGAPQRPKWNPASPYAPK
ncbi:MAG: M20/M25/M40 family metallo-hydrolase [Acidobacteria bacterium]|nr:M20/M25/M40 family metallo-hydrolase [Acidobacteriota bacterium]